MTIEPTLSLLVKLGSAIVHLEEYLDTGHPFDKEAAVSVLQDSEVEAFMVEARNQSLLPVIRDHEGEK